MRSSQIAVTLLFLALAPACATAGRSTLTGAGAGAGVGAGIGALADPGPKGEGRIRNVFIGAAAGGLIGAGVGYLAHEEIADREKASYERGMKEAERTPRGEAPPHGAPVLLPPRVESRFVDEQIRGNVYVPAHFEYVIVEPARWQR